MFIRISSMYEVKKLDASVMLHWTVRLTSRGRDGGTGFPQNTVGWLRKRTQRTRLGEQMLVARFETKANGCTRTRVSRYPNTAPARRRIHYGIRRYRYPCRRHDMTRPIVSAFSIATERWTVLVWPLELVTPARKPDDYSQRLDRYRMWCNGIDNVFIVVRSSSERWLRVSTIAIAGIIWWWLLARQDKSGWGQDVCI